MWPMRLVRLGNLYYDEELLDRVGVFADREDAGDRLGSACREVLGSADAVYAIPMGGVPVGAGVAKALSATLDLLICRKLLIPWNREAGFGAVAPDGTVYVDRELARQLGLGDEDVRAAVEEQLEEVKRRNRVLRGGRGYPSLAGKAVVVVDDGIAAGYTMRAAVEFLRRRGARRVCVAVPTGHGSSVMAIAGIADVVICLNVRCGPIFAVADTYREWKDLTDEDVMRYLRPR